MNPTNETDLLAPIEIWEIPIDCRTIQFHKPLMLRPEILDRGTSGECFFAESPELDISAVGINLDELSSCIRSDIRMTWKRIVQKVDNELTPDERTIKRRFLEIAEEIDNG